MCACHHVHAPDGWEKVVADIGRAFSTKEEAEYTAELAFALATCLSEALSYSQSKRSAMAAETRAHIEASFSTTLMCDATIRIYKRLLKALHSAGN